MVSWCAVAMQPGDPFPDKGWSGSTLLVVCWSLPPLPGANNDIKEAGNQHCGGYKSAHAFCFKVLILRLIYSTYCRRRPLLAARMSCIPP